MDFLTVTLFICGIVFVVAGADVLVRGASRLALRVGISPLVIGLTVVAFGTSAPETAVMIKAAYAGQADLSVGNIVGSNIFNILFVLGISSLWAPLVVSQKLVRLDVPIMIGVSLLVLLMSIDGSISRFEGGILLAGLIAYTLFAVFESRTEPEEIIEEYTKEFGPRNDSVSLKIVINLLLIAVGLVMLTVGSKWLVDGAVVIAQALGISQLVIGLTIVAAGTSLPEVATSVIATIRGERDIAVGNVVGSCLFNLLGALGLSSLIAPASIPIPTAAIFFDMPVMIAVSLACLPVFFTGREIQRWEGFLFLAYYGAYTLYLLFESTEHSATEAYSWVMLAFVIPITVITLLVLTARQVKEDIIENGDPD